MNQISELLTVSEAADYLKVPVSWIYERTRTRSIPVRKIGRHCRIPKDELIAWIDRESPAQKIKKIK
jgi:excisionase family DNA binding protein